MLLTPEKTIASIRDFGPVAANIEIGGKESGIIIPNLNVSFCCHDWNDQEHFYLNLNRKDLLFTDKQFVSEQNQVSTLFGTEKHIWKQVDNKLKWNIEFAQKPPSNVFEWELKHSENMRFLFQPDLAYEFYNVENDGFDNLEDFLAHHGRPDDVVGSYAVYCNRAGLYRRNGVLRVNYGTGKLCHIYRPLCIDADGKKIWAELHIADGILRITIPQTFLDTAKYPVTLDPDIGFTTLQDSGYATDTRCRVHLDASLTTAGAFTGMSVIATNGAATVLVAQAAGVKAALTAGKVFTFVTPFTLLVGEIINYHVYGGASTAAGPFVVSVRYQPLSPAGYLA